ncbi:MAG: hypothetical protein RJB62_2031 [Pseudomonadota bacterium]|jgi:hypothetical protein
MPVDATFKALHASRIVWLSTMALLAGCTQEAAETTEAAPLSVTEAATDMSFMPVMPATPQDHVPSLAGWWQHNVSHLADPETGEGPVSHLPGMQHLYGQDRGQGLPGTDLWIGNYNDPLLQPWAADLIRARGEKEQSMGQSDWQLLQLCMLVGTPHILLLRDPVEFLQEDDMVTIFYHRDQQVRRVSMNAQHPENVVPSPYGHSVGWYEGESLVIDTVGMTNVGPIDYYGTPHTDALHVVERYTVIEDGAALHAEVFVEDAGTFTAPWMGTQRYDRSRREQYEEIRCADNPRDTEGGEYPIPTDLTADF